MNPNPPNQRGPFDELSQAIQSIPPITRGILFLTVTLSLSLQFGLISPKQVILHYQFLLKGELWRLVTNLCLSSGFGLLMHCYFLYQNCSLLETGIYANRRADFVWMLLFIILNTDLVGIAFGLSVLTNSFSMALIYVWSQLYPDQTVNFMFGFQFKASYFPWVLVALDVVTGGSPVPSLVGIAVGHFYHFLENVYPNQLGGTSFLKAPAFLSRWLDTERMPPTTSSSGYTAIPGQPKVVPKPSNPSSSSWGKGYKLGTE